MLINRNITVNGHRTSIRLEPEFWAGFADIAQHENLSIDELCGEVELGTGDLSRTAAIRIFIASYLQRRAQQSAEQQPQPFTTVGGTHTEQPGPAAGYPLAAQGIRATG